MNDIEIIDGSLNNLSEIYSRFKIDFLADERKEFEHLEMLMIKKKYKLLLAKHKVFNNIIGYAFIYEVTNPNVLWLDYIAIDVRFQNAGYGTLLFNKIAESKSEGILGIFLEVEIPNDKDQEKERRIKFYERLGAKRLSFDYQLPTKNGGYPMYLYFRPSPNVHLLPKDQIKESIVSAFDYIHSDVPQKDTVLKDFLSSISDEYFN